MKKIASVLFIVGLACSGLAGEMPWAKDWADAQKSAAASKKLIMVDFYTDW